MKQQTRRSFLSVAAGASMMPLLSAQESRLSEKTRSAASQNLPVAINLIGPMAFRRNIEQKTVDVWMPELDKSCGKEHQAGIVTSLGTIPVGPAKDTIQKLNGPVATGSHPEPYSTGKCKLYPIPKPTKDPEAFIHLQLPNPKSIVALMPVCCRVNQSGSKPSPDWGLYAVGLRFLYQKSATTFTLNNEHIPLDTSPDEPQIAFDIRYVPLDFKNDSDDEDAKCAFNKLSKLFPPADLTLDFGSCPDETSSAHRAQSIHNPFLVHGPLTNCKAPILWVE